MLRTNGATPQCCATCTHWQAQPPLHTPYCGVHRMWLPQGDLRRWTCPHWQPEQHETFAQEIYETLERTSHDDRH